MAASKEYKLNVDKVSLKPGEKLEVEVEGIEGAKVLLVHVDGKVQAIGPRCTHYGAPLAKGVLSPDGRLTCPWHGACFNAKTGDIEDSPALDALPTFPVTYRDGAVYISGDEATIKSGRRAPKFKCAVASAAASSDHVVVVGGGSGALGAVDTLRGRGYAGAVTIISSEGYYPIDRPKLSKSLMTDLSKLTWRNEEWYRAGSVEWVGDEVVDVDFSAKAVKTKKGGSYSYTKLILATGGTPRTLPLDGFKTLGNVFTLRTVHDAEKINAAIGAKGKKIVIVGSSFIGMELACTTCKDNTVTVIGMEKVPLERVLGEAIGSAVLTALEAKGVKFYLSAGVEKADASNADNSLVGAVVLKDGTRIEADLVVLGVGVAPATQFLRDNKAIQLEKDGSLRTDENFAVVGLEDVYAVGDIATFPYHGPGGDGKPLRIEHWNVAQNAGRVAAAHITSPAPSPAKNPIEADSFFIPVFWSALHGQMRYCGSGAVGWDELVMDGDVAESKFVAYYCRGDAVVAVASMGRDPYVMKAAELMRLGKMPSKGELLKADLLSL